MRPRHASWKLKLESLRHTSAVWNDRCAYLDDRGWWEENARSTVGYSAIGGSTQDGVDGAEERNKYNRGMKTADG